MKAIAEYFRDLAADDRYFGAEPPTPDAEMLARIAEREIERRVSARMDHGAIVLKATDRVEQTDSVAQDDAPVQDTTVQVNPAQSEDTPVNSDADTTNAEQAAKEASAADVVEPEVADVQENAQIDDTAEDDKPTGKIAAGAAAIAAVAAAVVAPDADAEEAKDEIAETLEEDAADVVAEANEDITEVPAEDFDADQTGQNNALELAAEDGTDAFDVDAITDTVSEDVAEMDLDDASFDDADFAELIDEDTNEELFVDATEAEDTIDALAAADVLVLEDSIKAAMADDLPETAEIVEEPAAEVEILDAVVDTTELDDDAEGWDDEGETEYEENSIAAKLERIRAVVARGNNKADDDGFSEDEHANDLAAAEAPIATAFDPIDSDLEAGDDVASTAQAEDFFTAEDEAAGEDSVEDTAEETATPIEKPALRARVVRMKKADFEEAVASGLLEAEPVDDDEDEEDDGENAFAQDDAVDTSLTPEDEADLMAELAQVEAELKGDPAPVAEEVAQFDAEFDDEFEDETEDAPTNELEEDLEADAEDTAEAVSETNEATMAAEQPHGEPDLSRLMAKANSEMKEPEGTRRRRAIAHLRAAVAATRAEKAAGGNAINPDSTVAYRDDLASVVRAVPGGKDKSSAQPAPTKPRGEVAPLKLVAEQRIDAKETAVEPAPVAEPAAQTDTAAAPEVEEQKAPRRVPVRPRRVSTDRIDREEIARTAAPVGSVSSVQGGFAEYAQSVGATSMPQVLEAAAAYVTFVKGHERFSRPMLMRMARDVDEAEFSREDGLRSFGQLLREQKIRKIAGGRFTADESINFKPQDRAAS
jgi:hypothetical protein